MMQWTGSALGVWIEETFVSLGPLGIFVIAFFDSSFLSLPEINDIILFGKAAGAGWMAPVYALAATLGSASGCSLLYVIGRLGGERLVYRLFPSKAESVKRTVVRYGAYTVLVPAVLPPPLPFKIFVLSAGVFGIPYRSFIQAILLGRSIRYFGEAAAAAIFGEVALAFFIEHPYMLAAAALAVFGVGFAARAGLKSLLVRRGVLE